MTKRMIDADALLEQIKTEKDNCPFGDPSLKRGWGTALMNIEQHINLLVTPTLEPGLSTVIDDFYQGYIGVKVLVRHNMCGVNFGTVKSFNDKNIVLVRSKKLWQWHLDQGVCLEDLAVHGLSSNKSKSRISSLVDEIIIPNDNNVACVLIASKECEESIMNAQIARQD